MPNLVAIDIRMDAGETRSGVQALSPKIFARYEPGADRRLAYVLVHPTNNFMNHYLVGPLAASGAGVLAMNTRYAGNETFLILERAMLDLGAGVAFLRSEGYRHICLIGNSGGAALATLYQAEAERASFDDLPDGRALHRRPEDTGAVDSLALIAAHPGRAITLTARLDASLLYEHDLYATDPSLDVFDPANGPPFSEEFLARVRAAQLARNRRITAWCRHRLREFADAPDGRPVSDQIFPVYRTMADPRFVDLALEPNGRSGGAALDGDTAAGNYAVSATAAACTLRSWLSQWSYDLSRGNGPQSLSRTSLPTLCVQFAADEIVYPSDVRLWREATPGHTDMHEMQGISHYPQRHPGAVEEVAALLTSWTRRTA